MQEQEEYKTHKFIYNLQMIIICETRCLHHWQTACKQCLQIDFVKWVPRFFASHFRLKSGLDLVIFKCN